MKILPRQLLALWLILAMVLLAACRRASAPTPYVDALTPEDSAIIRCYRIDTLQRMVQQFQDEGDHYRLMLAQTTLGKRYRESSRFEEAITSHREALFQAEELRDTTEIIQILNQLGTDYRRVDQLQEASDCLYQALSHYEAFSLKAKPRPLHYRVSVLNGIGNVQAELGNNQEAVRLFHLALEAEQASGNILGQAINYSNLGSALRSLGQSDSARYYYALSMEANRQVNSKVGLSLCHLAFGELNEEEGLWKEAMQQYKAAYDLLLYDKDRWHWFFSCTSLARLHLQLGHYSIAASYIDEAMAEACKMKSPRSLRDVYRLKSSYAEHMGRYDEAQRYFYQATLYNDSINSEKSLNHMQNLRVTYEREKARQAAQLMRAEQAGQRQFYLIVILAMAVVVASVTTYLLLMHLHSRRNYIRNLQQKNSELQAMHERLERSEMVKTLFIQNISHELRTPLNAISGFAQMLTVDELPVEDRILCSDHIERNTRLLTRLVNDLLDLSTMQAGQMQLRTSAIVPQDICRSVAQQVTYLLPSCVALRLDLADEQILLQSDEKRLSQILLNLLTNACQHTTQGCITLSLAADDQWVRFVVTDTGCGVPPDQAELIFERFGKVDRYRQGAGLGLYLCRCLSEAMGGHLYLDTSYTGGARFVLELPH